MSDEEPDLSRRDAAYVGRFMPLLRFATRYYFRSEVRDSERIPAEGGALVVSNHSGGLIAMDVPVIAVAYFDHYGMDAPLYVLAHDMLWRGEFLARLLRLQKLLRTKYMPVAFGFPFGLTFAFPSNLPLPSKLVTQVLEPIAIRAEFGDDPDIAAVDEEVRRRMQAAMDELGEQRRFPVIG